MRYNNLRNVRNVMKTGGLTIMAVLGMTVFSSAEENIDIESLFYNYASDNQVYDESDSANLSGWTGMLEFKKYNGYLALHQMDLDRDGSEELLAVRIKQPDDKTDQNNLLAEVYQYQGDKLKRVAQCNLAEDILYTSEVQIDVFLTETENGIYLCCEDKEAAAILADGVDWNLRVFTYDGNAFAEQTNVEIEGSDWDAQYEEPAVAALNAMGLYPAQIVSAPVTAQVGNVTRINSISRYLTEDIQQILYYLDNPEAEMMEYGMTVFHSYQNENLENKISDTFVSFGDHYRYEGSEMSQENTEEDDYILLDSDSRYITTEDLDQLSEYEILLARNEIYARHGRIFNNEDLNAYFRSKSWYQPLVSGADFTEEYAASVFNDMEARNIDTIVTYEREHDMNQF